MGTLKSLSSAKGFVSNICFEFALLRIKYSQDRQHKLTFQDIEYIPVNNPQPPQFHWGYHSLYSLWY